jgi:hypothetical protein
MCSAFALLMLGRSAIGSQSRRNKATSPCPLLSVPPGTVSKESAKKSAPAPLTRLALWRESVHGDAPGQGSSSDALVSAERAVDNVICARRADDALCRDVRPCAFRYFHHRCGRHGEAERSHRALNGSFARTPRRPVKKFETPRLLRHLRQHPIGRFPVVRGNASAKRAAFFRHSAAKPGF